jgi:SsrA-binding protein
VLTGTEVKTLRTGQVSLEEAFVKIVENEAFLVGAHIEEYAFGNRLNHVPTRRRKLLLHRRQIDKWRHKATEKGYTLVPLELYFNDRNRAQVKIALGRGKKLFDKRQAERKKEARKEIRRALP